MLKGCSFGSVTQVILQSVSNNIYPKLNLWCFSFSFAFCGASLMQFFLIKFTFSLYTQWRANSTFDPWFVWIVKLYHYYYNNRPFLQNKVINSWILAEVINIWVTLFPVKKAVTQWQWTEGSDVEAAALWRNPLKTTPCSKRVRQSEQRRQRPHVCENCIIKTRWLWISQSMFVLFLNQSYFISFMSLWMV